MVVYVETGIELRIPYRKVFTLAGAAQDMRYWNDKCNVNWSVYRFSRSNGRGLDLSSLYIDKFCLDVDVFQLGVGKINTETIPKLEDYFSKYNYKRLWILTEHGMNCYLKAPTGCGINHAESMWEYLTHKLEADIDPCMIDPLAQRKAINSFIHGEKIFAIPLTTEEVYMDIEELRPRANAPRPDLPSYWTGDKPFRANDLSYRKRKEIRKSISVDTEGLSWPVNPDYLCPVWCFMAAKEHIGFWDRLDMMRYLRAVVRVPLFLIENVMIDLIGEDKWKSMSGWKRITRMSSSVNSFFQPKKWKAYGYCPKECFWCHQKIKEHEDLMDLL
jgi:hypothetical protein